MEHVIVSGYDTLKNEQLERIKQRDMFLNLNIVALAGTSAVAVQGERQAAAWLVIPWITAIMGWAYTTNDDKVSAIARFLSGHADAPVVAWESSRKGLLPVWVRRTSDSFAFTLSFVAPTPAAIYLYAASRRTPWAPATWVIVASEVAVVAGLLAVYCVSALRR